MHLKTVALLNVAVLLLCLCCGAAFAQTAAPVLSTCANATGISFNQTELFGKWYEVSRYPSGPAKSCIAFDAGLLSDNSTLHVNVTYSIKSNDGNYQNSTEWANVTLVANQTTGYNVTYVLNNQNQTPVFTKLLANYTDSNGTKWIAGCGYTNASNPNTTYSYLLASTRAVSSTTLKDINNKAAQSFLDFSATNYTTIQQADCYRNSAATVAPMLYGVIAALYVLAKTF